MRWDLGQAQSEHSMHLGLQSWMLRPTLPLQVDVEVIVSEPTDRYTVDINATWGIQPGPNGSPVLSSVVPSGCR